VANLCLQAKYFYYFAGNHLDTHMSKMEFGIAGELGDCVTVD